MPYTNSDIQGSASLREVPIAVLWDGILLLPLVGSVDSNRSLKVMDSLCLRVEQTEASVVIIDILGVPTVDSKVAHQLISISRAVSLMGCDCVLTGISPQIAQILVKLNVELGDIVTRSRLKDGLKYAFQKVNLMIETNTKVK